MAENDETTTSESAERREGELQRDYIKRRRLQAQKEARPRPPEAAGNRGTTGSAIMSGTGTVGAPGAAGAAGTPIGGSTAPMRTAPESGEVTRRGSRT